MNTTTGWDRHYQRPKAVLRYPDENLVRLLKHIDPGPALDLGCGSGRHIALLAEHGFAPLTGLDTSPEALRVCRELYPEADFAPLKANDPEARLPFGDYELKLVVIWGVLHYNEPAARERLCSEIARVLAPDGLCLGTLRARGDTHYQKNADINQVDINYFDESESRALLARDFQKVELGYMERSPVGRLEDRVRHWIFRASEPRGFPMQEKRT